MHVCVCLSIQTKSAKAKRAHDFIGFENFAKEMLQGSL